MKKFFHAAFAVILLMVDAIAGAADTSSVPAPTLDMLDKAMNITKQIIAAATPIAQKAYAAGLLTLQIDAVQGVVLGFVFLAGSIFSYKLLCFSWKKLKEEDCEVFISPIIISGIGAVILPLMTLMQLLDVWLWVKLFNPELWLVHMAIEKLVK